MTLPWERRFEPRALCNATVYLLWGGRRIRCRATDLSSCGVFVSLRWPSVPSGTALEAVFPLVLRKSVTTVFLRRVHARVVRVDKRGLALDFR